MKKMAFSSGIAMLVMALFAGCTSAKLSENFDESKLILSAEDIIHTVHNRDFSSFLENAVEQMKSAISEDSFNTQVVALVESKGDFVAFKNKVAVGSKGPNGENLGTVVVIAEYAKGKIQYTITFDEDMKLSGFYLK